MDRFTGKEDPEPRFPNPYRPYWNSLKRGEVSVRVQ